MAPTVTISAVLFQIKKKRFPLSLFVRSTLILSHITRNLFNSLLPMLKLNKKDKEKGPSSQYSLSSGPLVDVLVGDPTEMLCAGCRQAISTTRTWLAMTILVQ